MSGPNRITQHVPNFVDLGDEKPRSAEFSTLDELRAIPWVAQWERPTPPTTDYVVTKFVRGRPVETKETHRNDRREFYRWSLDDNALMCESNEGTHWWVVGFIGRPEDVDLPKWVPVGDGHDKRDEGVTVVKVKR